MQKHVNLVDLGKSFPTNIFLQKLASIQKRTNPIKSAHSVEKSENGSISNLSTKATAPPGRVPVPAGGLSPQGAVPVPAGGRDLSPAGAGGSRADGVRGAAAGAAAPGGGGGDGEAAAGAG